MHLALTSTAYTVLYHQHLLRFEKIAFETVNHRVVTGNTVFFWLTNSCARNGPA